MEREHFDQSNRLNERKVTLKRRYTENHPAITAGKSARIRNKMLEAIADGSITQEEFDNIIAELSTSSKRWMKHNAKYFNVSEEGISLSKFGKRVLNQIKINENNQMRNKLVIESFSEFIRLNENTEMINEGTRGQFGIIDKKGNIQSVYTHYDSYPEYMLPIIKKNYKNAKQAKEVIAKGDNSGLDALDKMNFYGDPNAMNPMKGKKSDIDRYIKLAANDAGAEYIYLYDESDKKWYMVDVYGDRELVPAFESVVNEENEQLFEAEVEMDALDPDNKDFLKFLKKNRVKIIAKTMEGPAGGHPVITMQGKKKDLENVLADCNYGWCDEDLAEYIEESVSINLNEWAVRGMDANFDSEEDLEYVRGLAKKVGVRVTYDPDGNAPYAGALSLSGPNPKAILKIAAVTGHAEDIKDGLYDLVESVSIGLNEWAVRGMDANFDSEEDLEYVRGLAKKVGVRVTYDPDGNAPYAGALSLSGPNPKAILKIAAVTGHAEDIKDGLYDLVESYENEEAETLTEAFKSSKLRNLVNMDQAGSDAYGKAGNLAKALYGLSKIKLDQIEDQALVDMDPMDAYKQYANNKDYIVFYILDNETDNPHADRNSYRQPILKPGILALSRGKEFLGVHYDQRDSRGYNDLRGKRNAYSLYKSEEGAVGGNKKYRGYDASGIASVVRAAKLADRAIVFNIVAGGESSRDLVQQRADAQSGALAFKSDKDFKKANLQRYKDILATKASKLPLDKMIEDAINELSNQIKDGLSKGEKGRYGDIIIGRNKRGSEVRLRDASNHMSNILDDYNRYVDYVAQAEREKESGFSSNYYEKQSNEYAKSISDKVKKIKEFNYAW
jgi:hypothetical protein